ncbi:MULTISPECIES: penicillin-binding transpeptidase domain-containing protein [Shouchella]|uniref:serine-type D-Ala-D-Ala carboxypeptidase n=1 Tax=Shouchella hunanensis TaxID=766894 RepID=A0ABY7W6G8_9BACI|nr:MULTISPECIES: penicillin-binding transpeptidase domain-containing protein [Shouchella]WDF04508.1 penicillin-binding transpeptidase domain-containing protein [Shouchella hunanensis]
MKKAAVFSTFSIISIFLAACSTETPENSAQSFIDHWENRDYASMYQMVTSDVQESISEEDFIARYENIYDGLINDFTIEAIVPEEFTGENEEQIPVNVSMTTVAGEYEFEEQLSFVWDEREDDPSWKLEWGSQLIFPDLSDEDSVRYNASKQKRGEIFDKEGQGLAINGEVIDLAVVPNRFEEEESEIAEIADRLGRSKESIEQALDQSWVEEGSLVLIGQMPASELEAIEALYEDVPGFTYQMSEGRVYPFGEAAAHLIGYIRPITAEQLEERREEGYTEQSLVGQTGLELIKEEQLRGAPGGEIVIVDADGERKETIVEREAEDGDNVHLTIRMDLQEELMNELDGEPGTAVALDSETGETLALVSSPSYDPNQMTLGLPSAQREELEENEDQPLLNRFSNRFSPGSTMKAITAAIGVDSGTVDPNETVDEPGHEWQPADSDWGGYHVRRVTDPNGAVDLFDAMAYSDNIYFAQAALAIGEEELLAGAEAFGFNETFAFTYSLQQSLLTGEEGFKSEIQLADTGYGQGEILTNPVHLAAMFTTFINEGQLIQPILEQEEETGQVLMEPVSAETATLVDEALKYVVSSDHGTAHSLERNDYAIAAKTGTAEVGEDTLGWVVSYESDESNLLLAIMQEGVGSGDVLPIIDHMYNTFLD